MFRRWLQMVSLTLVAALTAPGALAMHDAAKNPPGGLHVPVPTNIPAITDVKAVCEIVGVAHIDDAAAVGGISATEHNHNHYEFIGPIINCTDVNPLDPDYGGPYEIWADGGTDGCDPAAGSSLASCTLLKGMGMIPGHGEWTGLGWSHGSGYADGSINAFMLAPPPPTLWVMAPICDAMKNANQSGDIHVEGIPRIANGWVKFVRVGVDVTAWGCLEWTDPTKKIDFFTASLTFIPDPPGVPLTKDAILAGTAVIGN